LYLKIKQRTDGQGNALSGTFTVTLTDLDTKKSMEIASFNNNLGSTVNSGPSSSGQDSYGSNLKYDSTQTTFAGPHYKLIFDSLNPELRFSKIMGMFGKPSEDSFHPGCNLRVTVSFKGEKEMQEESFLTNSLFESVKEEGAEKTAYIACGRHLQNLSLSWVYDGNATGNLNGVNKAIQTKEIDWIVSLNKVFKDGNNLPSFKPIVNKNLEEFHGGGNAISHINISGNVEDDLLKGLPEGSKLGIGLFSTFEGNKLDNVKLVDCTVKNLTGSKLHVGLLAGIINNITNKECTVSNCLAYAKVDSGNYNPVKEDLCSIDVPTGADSVGGLFGTVVNNAKPTTIQKCAASLTKIAGGTYVGGLAGHINCSGGVTVTKCYADTGAFNSEGTGWQSGMSGTNVGGLLGNIDGSGSLAMKYSYAVGYVFDNENAYGLVGSFSSSNNTINYCYAALMKENDFVDELAPAGLDTLAKNGGCINYNGIYSCFDGLLSIPENPSENPPVYPYVKGSANTTNPYGLFEPNATSENKENTEKYPFPKLKDMPHYGDWPQEGLGVLMAYFELYQDNKSGKYSIGFFNDELFKNGENENKNTKYDLKDNNDVYTVVMDGYAVMLPVEGEGKGAKYGTIEVEKGLLDNQGLQDNRLIVKYNGNDVSTDELKLRNAKNKFKGINVQNDLHELVNGNVIKINLDGKTTVSYYPLFLSSAMMMEGEKTEQDGDGKNGYANPNSYYQKLEVQIKKTDTEETDVNVIKVYFNPYVAKSEFVKVEKDRNTNKDKEPPKVPEKMITIMRTSRQITAYFYDAMQNTASGKINGTHTLHLERDISLDVPFTTDLTVNNGGTGTNKNTCECKNLIFPDNSNVILELNGKTLTGKVTAEGGEKDGARVVTCLGGKLYVYGFTAKDQNGDNYAPDVAKGTISGGGIRMDKGEGLLKNLNIEYILNSVDGDTSIDMGGKVTVEGCTITSIEKH